jgi:transcriptional regulator with XRE-family HTH domain
MTFGQMMISLRLDRGLSQEQLAEVSGVSVRTISNLERGATRPRRDTVRALVSGLGLDVHESERLRTVADAV